MELTGETDSNIYIHHLVIEISNHNAILNFTLLLHALIVPNNIIIYTFTYISFGEVSI